MNDIILKGSFEIRYNTIPNKKEKAKQIAID